MAPPAISRHFNLLSQVITRLSEATVIIISSKGGRGVRIAVFSASLQLSLEESVIVVLCCVVYVII
ncbi:hypothetical protein WN943_024476 [Citrus x changshan-huyou]